ncbi:MAG: nucleotidyltransferase family protein [Muribaculaceae bacterium]
MEEKWNSYIIDESRSIIDALRQLNELSGKATTLFVVDVDGKVTGTLTDGDIRRSLISGYALDAPINEIMHRNFIALTGSRIKVTDVKELRRNKITLVPHLNDDGTIKHIYDFSIYHSLLPIDAVLMAGGKGERLRPLTIDTPKPLLKVGDKCIIDYNIEQLARNGISNISVTTNYLSEKIEQHFLNPIANVTVKCVKEPCRLGTIGALSLIDDFSNDTVLLMNSDLLTSINYEEFYLNHIEQGADMSVAVIPYMVSVPYAIFITESNRVRGLEEKPTYNYHANAGIYLIKRELLSLIPRNEYYDATDFLEALIARDLKVTQYPINGTWIDIGSPDDYRQAQELVKQRNGLDL